MSGYAKIEYLFEDIHGAKWLDRLNELGLEGWNIINLEVHSSANVWVLFSREKENDDGGADDKGA